METITATFEHEITTKPNADGKSWGVFEFRNKDFGQFTVVGVIDDRSMVFGLQLDIMGTWTRNGRHGRQFEMKSHSVVMPNGEEGTKFFLQQAEGIGPATSRKLWDRYGDQAIDNVINNPETVAKEMPGLNAGVILDAAQILKVLYRTAKMKIPLMSLLKGNGFPTSVIDKILACDRSDPIGLIRKNPYWLLQFSGVGFKTCDTLRRKLNLPQDMPERYRAALIHVMSQDLNGSVWLEIKNVSREMAELLGFNERRRDLIPGIIQECVDAREAAVEGNLIAIQKDATEERMLCSYAIGLRCSKKASWPKFDVHKDRLNQHQKDQIDRACAKGRLAVLMGNAGTGKTYCSAAIIRKALDQGWQVMASTPTAKAGLRLKESLVANDIKTVDPVTNHRLLGARSSGGGWVFTVDGIESFIDCDLLVIDEASMADNRILYKIFRALTNRVHVLMVGDPNQLPPVGKGTFLRDWPRWLDSIDERSGYGILSEVLRNSGGILTACDKIYQGKDPQLPKLTSISSLADESTNAQLLPCRNDESIQDNLRKFYSSFLQNFQSNDDFKHLDPVFDLQVLVATNRDTPASREELNLVLRGILNSSEPSEHPEFRLNDKVVCLKNSEFREFRTDGADGVKYLVANGEIGVVTKAFDKRVVVKFFGSGKELLVPTGEGKGDIDLAYCLSVHKSQGSSWPVVIVIASDSYKAKMVSDRSWLYTALTRAEMAAIVFGRKQTLAAMSKRTKIEDRKSMIKERLATAFKE